MARRSYVDYGPKYNDFDHAADSATLACLQSLTGNLDQTVSVESEAVAHGSLQSFPDSLADFRDRKDCAGDQ